MTNQNEYRCLTPKEIGDAVAMFRKMAGMKQLTLALEAGVTERTVQRIENGEKVNEESLRKIAEAFRMEETSFVGPRNILSKEEAWEKTKAQLDDLKLIDAHRFYGNQPQRVLTEAAQRPGVELTPEPSRIAAHGGMSYARERGMEREAVSDERSLMRDALKHTMGEARLPEIKAEFESRVESREFIGVTRREGLRAARSPP
jgi:transcriptional regulator with XRE-family HTH domain